MVETIHSLKITVAADMPVTMHYQHKQGQGLPVVFLHGINSGANSWCHQYGHFDDIASLTAWNMPGYAESQCYLAKPLAHDYADLVYQWTQAIGLKSFILVGHSLGGLIGYAYASRYADTLKGLMLASCTRGYGHTANEERERVANQRPQYYQQHGQEAYIAHNLQRLADRLNPEDFLIVKAVLSNITVEGISASSYLLAHSQIETYFHNVQVPFFSVCGTEDVITPFEDVRHLSHTLGAEFYAVEGASHPCYLENPLRFNEILRCFIHQCQS